MPGRPNAVPGTFSGRVNPWFLDIKVGAERPDAFVMKRHSLSLGALVVALLVACLVGAPLPDRPARGGPKEGVERILTEGGDGIEASVGVGGAAGPPWYERKSSVPRPAASAFKSALLVEFVARHARNLDEPLPSSNKALQGSDHPVMALLRPLEQIEVRQYLESATPRKLARVMMGTEPASNVVYNTAANLIIADLGGPEQTSDLIHRRSSAFAGSRLRRYMLAPRLPGGDNEATAASLAAVLRGLATRRLPGIDAATLEAMRQVVLQEQDPAFGRLYRTDGDLYTDPLAVVRAGWCEGDRGTVVYVVMTTRPDPGLHTHEVAYDRQRIVTEYLARWVFDWAWGQALIRGKTQGTGRARPWSGRPLPSVPMWGWLRLAGLLAGVAFAQNVQLVGPPNARGRRRTTDVATLARPMPTPNETLNLGGLRAVGWREK